MTVQLVPWARRAALGDELVLRVGAREAQLPLSHFGPGDVLGLERAEIVLRVPAPNSVGFAPNLMPFVELRSADLPWRMSAGATPWLALLVREAADNTAVIATTGPLLAIRIPGDQLPPWDERGLWCHAQAGADGALEGGFARVIAPRRLAPRTRYVACLVPCFEAGRLAGLGQVPELPRAETPAWTIGTEALLPIYDHWYFTTGDAGDFEALARRLVPQHLVSSAVPTTVDYGAVTEAPTATTTFTSLVPIAHTTEAAPEGAAAHLDGWLTAGATSTTPVLGPPIHGGGATGTALPASGWKAQANLDPRWRAAAGLGAEAVRQAQEELVAEAWTQLGALREANRERDRARLGTIVHARWVTKHVAPLDAATRLLLGAQGLRRLRRDATPLAREVEASVLPTALLSARFRRLAARVPRAQHGSLAALVTATAGRTSPLGTPTPRPAEILTVTELATALAEFPEDTKAQPSSPWADRRATLLDEAYTLRSPTFPTVEIERPLALSITSVAAVVTTRLETSLALVRHDACLDRGELVAAEVTRPLTAAVALDVPVVELLRRLDARYLVTSVGIPAESVGVLRPHAEFIEAVMLGANDELVRELHWRGAAIAPDATPLRRYFDMRGRTTPGPDEIAAVKQWSLATELGAHVASGQHTVLVIRGELVRRFADAIIYVARAVRTGGRRAPSALTADRREPIFRGMITDDTMFVGIDRSPTQLREEGGEGWFVVLTERPAGTRFGLDESDASGPLASWNELGWGHVTLIGGYVGVAASQLTPAPPGPIHWGTDGAHQGAITRQRPMRVAFHAAELIAGEA
jgi:hypothetical protein